METKYFMKDMTIPKYNDRTCHRFREYISHYTYLLVRIKVYGVINNAYLTEFSFFQVKSH